MVTNVTSLTGNGLKDWLIQRTTAVYLAIYTFFILGFLVKHSPLQYSEWHGLFEAPLFQIASIIALLMFTLHAWIGIWTVTTDYMKGTFLRIFVQFLVALVLMGQFIWGLLIVWGQ